MYEKYLDKFLMNLPKVAFFGYIAGSFVALVSSLIG